MKGYEFLAEASEAYGVAYETPSKFVKAVCKVSGPPWWSLVDWTAVTFKEWRRELGRIAPEMAGQDARLLLPMWEARWTPRQARRWGGNWFGHWALNQARPEVVGSSHNEHPQHVFSAYMSRVVYPKGWAYVMASKEGRQMTGSRRVQAMWALAKKIGQLRHERYPIQIHAKTADLVRMSKLSGACLRWLAARGGLTRGWTPKLETLVLEFQKLRAERGATLEGLRVPASQWDWDEAIRGLPWPQAREMVSQGWDLHGALKENKGLRSAKESFNCLLKAPWAQWAKKQGWLYGELHVLRRLERAAHKGKVLKEEDFKSMAHLLEALDAIESVVLYPDWDEAKTESDRERDYRKSQNSLARAEDRLAQDKPEWAISGWAHEHHRGIRIAGLIKAALVEIQNCLAKGETVLIHGRDGELLYQLLKRMPLPRRMRKLVKYAVTSRPVTTGMPRLHPKVGSMLTRILPKGIPAVHIDTGFAGSIPDWFARQGWNVSRVLLISAISEGRQMQSTKDYPNLREVVLGDLEHSAQRLQQLTHESPDKGFMYHPSAPGFWARLYGVCSVLGLPQRPLW
jgi:hypothetical protein